MAVDILLFLTMNKTDGVASAPDSLSDCGYPYNHKTSPMEFYRSLMIAEATREASNFEFRF
jgi:hypothetical protein